MFYFALLPCVCLWWLTRPLMSHVDTFKVKVVCLIAVSLIFTNDWLFRRHSIPFRRNNAIFQHEAIPIEDYFVMICQIISTLLWTFFCTRWSFHWIYLRKPNPISFYFIRYFGIFTIATIAVLGWTNGSAELKYLCGFLPPIACAWFVVGQYIIRRHPSTIVSVIIPSVFYYYIDVTDTQNQASVMSNKPISWNAMQLARLSYYVTINVLVVFLSAAIDKSKAVLNSYYPHEQFRIDNKSSFFGNMRRNKDRFLKGILTTELALSTEVFDDFICTFEVVNQLAAHKFFNMVKKLLQLGTNIPYLLSVTELK